jgi:hypothetical protein
MLLYSCARCLRELSGIDNRDGGLGLSRVGPLRLHVLDNVAPFEHLAEHHVPAVEPRGLDGGDEELGPVRVGPGVGHAQVVRALVLELEVLVLELLPVDALAAPAVAVREVPLRSVVASQRS